jgi:hypothetical protein
MASKTLTRLAEIAGEQWGLVTRRQARAAGIPLKTLDRLVLERSVLEPVAHGVYRLLAAPIPDHLDLRAAWLQLAPDRPAWDRDPVDGVVSHRSAAHMYNIGHLAADEHEFIVGKRKQSRRREVHLHIDQLRDNEWIEIRGLPVTMPSRIAFDLLDEDEDPSAVAQLMADAIRHVYDYPASFAEALAPHAFKFGFRRGDGIALLGWLLDLVGDPETQTWLGEARNAISAPVHEDHITKRGVVHPS